MRCISLIKPNNTKENKLAGLLLLLHLLKQNKNKEKKKKKKKETETSSSSSSEHSEHSEQQQEQREHEHDPDQGEGQGPSSRCVYLAEQSFLALDESFLSHLCSHSWRDTASVSLALSVCHTLARLSTQVASEPKLWRIANKTLHAAAQAAQAAQEEEEEEEEEEGDEGDRSKRGTRAGAEDVLELVLVSLQSLRVMDETRPECPRHLQDIVTLLVNSQGQAELGLAIKALWTALSRMSNERKVLTIINLCSSSSSSSNGIRASYRNVVNILVRTAGANIANTKRSSSSSLAPVDAIRALGLWLDPECLVVARVTAAEAKEWLPCLRDGMRTSMLVQRDCVKIAASLCKAFGARWILEGTQNQDASDGHVLEKEGFAYLTLLTAKTETSLLLSDALQPAVRLGGTGTAGAAGAGATAGDRASAHLESCFVVTDQAVEVVATFAAMAEEENGGDGGNDQEVPHVECYFMLLHDLVGVLIEYFLEVSKHPSELYRREINLAATRVLGRYLMEVPEFCLVDDRLPRIINTLTTSGGDGDGDGSGSGSVVVGSGAPGDSLSFGWTYLAPSLSQVCEEANWVAQGIKKESLERLLQLTATLIEEVRRDGESDCQADSDSEGKRSLILDCVHIADQIRCSACTTDTYVSERLQETVSSALAFLGTGTAIL